MMPTFNPNAAAQRPDVTANARGLQGGPKAAPAPAQTTAPADEITISPEAQQVLEADGESTRPGNSGNNPAAMARQAMAASLAAEGGGNLAGMPFGQIVNQFARGVGIAAPVAPTDTGETTETGETTDTGGTADTGDTAETGETGETGDTSGSGDGTDGEGTGTTTGDDGSDVAGDTGTTEGGTDGAGETIVTDGTEELLAALDESGSGDGTGTTEDTGTTEGTTEGTATDDGSAIVEPVTVGDTTDPLEELLDQLDENTEEIA